MSTLEIIRLLILLAVLLYIVIMVAVVSFLFRLRKRIDRDEQAVRALIKQRINLHQLFLSECHGLAIDITAYGKSDLINELIPVTKLSDAALDLKKKNEAIRSQILRTPEGQKHIDKEQIQTLLVSFEENDNNLRRKIAQYNRDVATYNYWVDNMFFIVVTRLFDLRRREKI